MMNKNIALTAVLAAAGLLFTCGKANAQDPRFTQYYATPLLVNPATMGASDDMRYSLAYRNQWGSVSSGYTTYAFNGMYPFFFNDQKSKLDVGLSVLDDKAGAFNVLNADLAVDYSKEIAEDQHICLALMGGFGQQSINTSGLTYDDQYVMGSYSSMNPSNETMINKQKAYADVGFGFVWYMNPSRDKSKINAFVGVSGYHMNEPNQSLDGSTSKLPMKMSYQGGLKILESNKVDIVPNAKVDVQAGNVESALGTYADYRVNDDFKLTLGLWYRWHDAIAMLIGAEYKGIKLGYSYDAVTSTLINYRTGLMTNEITLSYRLNRKKDGGAAPMLGTNNTGGSNTAAPATPEYTYPFPEF